MGTENEERRGQESQKKERFKEIQEREVPLDVRIVQ